MPCSTQAQPRVSWLSMYAPGLWKGTRERNSPEDIARARAAYKLGNVASLSWKHSRVRSSPFPTHKCECTVCTNPIHKCKCTVCPEVHKPVEITFRGKIRKYLLFHNKNKFFIQHSSVLKNFCSKVIYNLTNKQQFLLRALIVWGFFWQARHLLEQISRRDVPIWSDQECIFRTF